MTRKEYMEQLSQALKCFSPAVRAEVLEDYETHFTSGLDDGKTEDEICRELGSIELFIEELSQMETPTAEASLSDLNTQPIPLADLTPQTATKLILNGLHAEVTLSDSPDQKFHIYYECSGTMKQKLQYHFDWHEEGDTIYASVKKVSVAKGFFSSLTAPDITVKAQIPPYMNGIKVETVSGDIFASNLTATLQVKSCSGNIRANHLNGSFIFHTLSGDISAKHLTGPCQFNTSSGDIYAEYLNDSCIFNSRSGDIHVNQLSGSCVFNTSSGDIDTENLSGRCMLRSSSGDINVQGTLSECSIRTASGDVDVFTDTGFSGEIGTVSGDIEINLSDSKAGFIIDYSTISGDFEVNCCSNSKHISGKKGHTEIPGNGSYKLKLSTTSGDITLN